MKQRRPVVSNDVYEKVKGNFDTFEEGLNNLVKTSKLRADYNQSLLEDNEKLIKFSYKSDDDIKRLNSYILTQGVVNVALAAVIAAMVFLVY